MSIIITGRTIDARTKADFLVYQKDRRELVYAHRALRTCYNDILLFLDNETSFIKIKEVIICQDIVDKSNRVWEEFRNNARHEPLLAEADKILDEIEKTPNVRTAHKLEDDMRHCIELFADKRIEDFDDWKKWPKLASRDLFINPKRLKSQLHGKLRALLTIYARLQVHVRLSCDTYLNLEEINRVKRAMQDSMFHE
jgi:hypothetical protein